MKDIAHLTARLECHLFDLQFEEGLGSVLNSVNMLETAIDLLKGSEGFHRILTAILKLGNTMNSSDVKGFRLSTLPKLADVRSSTKPVRTVTQHIVDILFEQDRDALGCIERLKVPVGRVVGLERGPLEADLKELKNGITKIEKLLQVAEPKAAETPDDLMPGILRAFFDAASPRLAELQTRFDQVFVDFVEVCKHFGEKEAQAKKMTPKDLFGNVNRFLIDAEKTYKDLVVKETREMKRQEMLARRAEKAAK